MTHQRLQQATSLLSVLFFTFHWADEIARGLEPGTIDAAGGFAILFIWLYGTLAIADRRIGLAIMLLGALLSSGVPLLHMTGAGLVGKRIPPNTDGAFFWVWTNVALGASGMMSLAVSARRLRQSFGKTGAIPESSAA